MRLDLTLAAASLLVPALTSPIDATFRLSEQAPAPDGGTNAADGIDIVARMLADKFTDQLKSTLLVEIKARASNIIAADLMAAALRAGTCPAKAAPGPREVGSFGVGLAAVAGTRFPGAVAGPRGAQAQPA